MRSILFILLTTVLLLSGCSQSKQLSSRAPTKAELKNFIESMNIEVLTKKVYSDYAVILGVNSIYSLAILNDGKPQFLGSSWGGGNADRIDVSAVTQQSPFIGVIIYQNDIISQGSKLEVVFEDKSTVKMSMNREKAYIIEHPSGKVTNIDNAIVNIFNSKDELIWTR
ncbi:hypothetical protein [Paenibacillus macerans]|uniref:hypothetical protein n=1 Tax=Paenibacillus macerans TaxID=44252 RepID=UPI003D318054